MLYIDCTRLLEWSGGYTGIERFAFEVIRNSILNHDDVKLCFYSNNEFIPIIDNALSSSAERLVSNVKTDRNKQSIKALLRKGRVDVATKEFIARKRIDGSILDRNKQIANNDTLLVLDGLWNKKDYSESLNELSARGVKIMHVVHDIAAIIEPQLAPDYVGHDLERYFGDIAHSISTLISISKNTENDFIRIFGNKMRSDSRKIVVRHGDDIYAGSVHNPEIAGVQSGNFILTVGTVEIRKNHQLLYQTYRLARSRNINLPKLVIVGKQGWMVDDLINTIKSDPVIGEDFIFPGFVSDAQLAWLYDNCLFTVFPSLYEGWGLPVAESLKRGKVCACSNRSSIPEIGNDLCVYYDPYSADEALNAITKLLDDTFRSKLESKVLKQYSSVRWSDTAGQIYAAYAR